MVFFFECYKAMPAVNVSVLNPLPHLLMHCCILWDLRVLLINVLLGIQVALMRNDGTMYNGFYDRQLVVTVSSEPGSPSSTIPEDKQVIPDDNVLNYEILPGMTDLIIRISVSKFHLILKIGDNDSF